MKNALSLVPRVYGCQEGSTMSEFSGAYPKILRIKQVQERTGLGRSTIYDRINSKSPRYDASFPRPVRVGQAAIGWVESSISEWIESLAVIKET